MNKQLILKKCQEVIDSHNDHNTLYELTETIKADGLTLYEAEVVCQALDNYMSGANYYFRSGEFNGKEPQTDQFSCTTPTDIVKELEINNRAIPNKETMYEQVTCIERWGYEMGEQTNAHYFDPLFNAIINGNAKSVVDDMKEWSKSDVDLIPYSRILEMATKGNERIVYDDMTYLLTANKNIIVLYRKC